MSKGDGGPAFPTVRRLRDSHPHELHAIEEEGMTLRDYFAAKAMQGACSNTDYLLATQRIADRGGGSATAITVRNAYELADAMLKAREETDE